MAKRKPFEWVLTGTAAYGPLIPDSDIDIVMLDEAGTQLLKEIFRLKIEETPCGVKDDYDGYKFRLLEGFPWINIVLAEDRNELECWRLATEKMKTFPPITDKTVRTNTFIKHWLKFKEILRD